MQVSNHPDLHRLTCLFNTLVSRHLLDWSHPARTWCDWRVAIAIFAIHLVASQQHPAMAQVNGSTAVSRTPPTDNRDNAAHENTETLSVAERKRIDRLADNTPIEATVSIARLAFYLSNLGETDAERARALFRWVTRNIHYDAASAISGRVGDQRASTVLERRTATSEGYAYLTQAIGVAMGLSLQTIPGRTRVRDTNADSGNRRPVNHVWNAVRIGRNWCLLDTTWGSGYLDDDMRFVSAFQDHYFLTAPERFILDHLPDNPRWQFIMPPVSLPEFDDLPEPRPAFWKHGLRIGNRNNQKIFMAGRTHLTFGTEEAVRMAVQWLDGNGRLVQDAGHVFIQQTGRQVRIDIAPARRGWVTLRVFAGSLYADPDSPLDWVIDYRLNVRSPSEDGAFPQVFSAFNQPGFWLHEPQTARLQTGVVYPFRVRAPRTFQVGILNAGTFLPLQAVGDEWVGDITLKPGEAKLVARVGTSTNTTSLLKYQVEE